MTKVTTPIHLSVCDCAIASDIFGELGVELLQTNDQLTEGGSLVGRHCPAVSHHSKKLVRTVDGLGEPVAVPQIGRHLERIDFDVRLLR